MIVYAVVWAHGWEDGVRGVFSTEERALVWLEDYLAGWDEPYRSKVRARHRVQAWTVDDPGAMSLIDWHVEAEGVDSEDEA